MEYEVKKPVCERIVKADVVALEQVYYYNRFGAFNPAGIMYALRRDVVEIEDENSIINGDLDLKKNEKENTDRLLPGQVKLRHDKRPRPLVLRANEGDCLDVTFTNLLSPGEAEKEFMVEPERRLANPPKPISVAIENEEPATRHAGMHVNGLSLIDSIESQGANIGQNGWYDQYGKKTDGKCSSNPGDLGKNLCALAAPGETRTYRWYAKKEGTYFLYSMGAPAGGEGDGGQVGLGLFGAINVQPKGAKWYRSQVTAQDLKDATAASIPTKYGQPVIDYEKTYEKESLSSHHRIGDPILNMAKTIRNENWAEPTFEKKLTGKDEPKCKPGLLSSKDGQPMCHFPEMLEIVHSDLNAVIDIQHEEGCSQQGEGNACGKPYREFTVIFHDEATVVQAFHELEEEGSALSSLRDGMAINYGASGLGAMVVASRMKGVGPGRDCVECKLEEFFLTSWVNGDPAMVVGYKNGKPYVPYADDPSNVHHSYLGDPIRFRNMHAGPKETHVFHLHAHQWVQDKHDPLSHYLDSQTISPGSTFSYEVHYGGSGNRNLGPGDSIFHCHLYPHFAQGMWELWRSHDVFEDGSATRLLPDNEITDGTPIPAIVPLPHSALPPMPSDQFKGYPFYIAGKAGHRPPQPPRDLDGIPDSTTLRRHIILGGTTADGKDAEEPKTIIEDVEKGKKALKNGTDLYSEGKHLSDKTARRVFKENQDLGQFILARQLKTANIETKDEHGTPYEHGTEKEKIAMEFHAGWSPTHGGAVGPGGPGWTHTAYNWEAPGYPSCKLTEAGVICDDPAKAPRVLFRVSGVGKQEEKLPQLGMPGAPFANPCPKQYVDENGKVRDVQTREYRAAYIQMDMQVNKAGWHDPQARFPVLEEDVEKTLNGTRPTEPLFFRANSGECVVFKATNLIPGNLNLDDFQVYSPTDTLGQHIHLVKFDVTSSDGSGNGWNYEDGTLAADEVRERIVAHNRHVISGSKPGDKLELLEPKTHRLFLKPGPIPDDQRGICPQSPMVRNPGESNTDWMERWEKWAKKAAHDNPWCGAQTTVQRWWADPILNGKPGDKDVKDRTMRTVFTHDHFGASSHQQHGFYAALVVEPRNSKWLTLDGQEMGGTDEKEKPTILRKDGGPTSYAANIIVRDKGTACVNAKTVECSHQLDNKKSIERTTTGREFNLAFADFAIVYTSDKPEDEPVSLRQLRPINPPSQREGGLLNPVAPGFIPAPEGISTKDPGTQLINYRNEPIPLRIGERKEFGSADPVPSPWSCLPVENGKKSCFVQKPGEKGDMAHVFSSKVHEGQGEQGASIFTEERPENGKRLSGRYKGDPATPLLQAYDGDRVQIRLIQGAQEEQHVFTMHGARWLSQPDSPNSGYVNAQQIGISEHFEIRDQVFGLSSVPKSVVGRNIEGTNQNELCRKDRKDSSSCTPSVDLLLASSAIDNLWDGQWGLLRMYPTDKPQPFLARLPGNDDTHPFTSAFRNPDVDEWLATEEAPEELMRNEELKAMSDPVQAYCEDPAREAFLKAFTVEAWLAKDILPGGSLVYNEQAGITDPHAILFVEQGRVSTLKAGARPEPLILRARAGDCIQVTLINRLHERMPDDLPLPNDPADLERWQKSWTWNMVPPIIEGFNLNQIRSSNRVGLHAALLDQNVTQSDGAHVGANVDTTVPQGKDKEGNPYSKTYLWYAGDLRPGKGAVRGKPIEFGVVPLTDPGDVIKHPTHGGIGALIIEPQCSEFNVDQNMQAAATITWWEPEPETDKYGKPKKSLRCPAKPHKDWNEKDWKEKDWQDKTLSPRSWFSSEDPASRSYFFREFVLLYQDALSLQQYGQPIPNLRNGDDAEDSGQKAFNYRTEPLWARLGASAADEPDIMNEMDWSNVLSSTVSNFHCQADWAQERFCDPATPIFTAKTGEPLRFRVVHPGGHPRQHALAVFGHDWQLNPWQKNSTVMGWNQFSPTRLGSTGGIGPARSINILTTAGGDCKIPGDYLYRTQEGFMFGGGLWGILRVGKNDSLVADKPDACKIDKGE